MPGLRESIGCACRRQRGAAQPPPSPDMIGLSRLAASVAIASQCAGLVLAVLTPLDNQGFVGKAMWAVFAQFVALPSGGSDWSQQSASVCSPGERRNHEV